MKKLGIVASILIFTIIVVAIAIKVFSTPVETYTIVTDYGDEFLIKVKVNSTWPKKTYILEYYLKDGEEISRRPIIETSSTVEKKERINAYYKDENIRCYIIDRYYLFKLDDEKDFRKVRTYELRELDPDEYGFLIPVAKKSMENRDYAINAIVFLIKSNDAEAIEIIRRYINNELTEEEMDFYRFWEDAEYYQNILEEYNIDY
ncbi:hypothetical protein RBH29_17325 [Herbivorax sp. ANBcel31]|uniref:hypothetical protein n=1 Tax=Herbivorax sp. ANBcel31 TaxID=3069754 RepID=UPI0027B70044|nr:hypothetical protein [Herbivorax sp. ANBcel31]MDQ2088187.1 hypothetical protein [Herbivorax sp. ANBcel31]